MRRRIQRGRLLIRPELGYYRPNFMDNQWALKSRKLVAADPGGRDRDGRTIPIAVKEEDTVLLPWYKGTEVKLGEKEISRFLAVLRLK